uniref:Uncharacterized protein n=1 Tax=Picea glauca TaxID=3330 RepID=A0A101LYF0_PICGL|nr:hypothetical protein ABT39_MTgene5861 [Picea glauca]QHR92117.1 hypothetical protein Q903MT_gene6153 [Picea sitchensis]
MDRELILCPLMRLLIHCPASLPIPRSSTRDYVPGEEEPINRHRQMEGVLGHRLGCIRGQERASVRHDSLGDSEQDGFPL